MTETEVKLDRKAPYRAWYATIGDITTRLRIDRRLARFEKGDTRATCKTGRFCKLPEV